MADHRRHWERVYLERSPEQVSWYEPAAERSLAMIEAAAPNRKSAILDMGGGASRLGGMLLEAGYEDVTVADLSAAALDRAKAELGGRAGEVDWVVADATDHDFGRGFDVWHDRALFHFMVEASDRDGYLDVLSRTLRPGGHLVLATFGPDGPTECSGLPASRYGIEGLSASLGPAFETINSEFQTHRTPSGREQQFLWARFHRADASSGSVPV